MKPIVNLIDLVRAFHVEPSDFGNITWFLSYTHKRMKTCQKTESAKNAIIFKTNEKIHLKTLCNKSKTGIKFLLLFFCFFKLTHE